MTTLADVARGLLVDAFITYTAICKEKEYTGGDAVLTWDDAIEEMSERIGFPDTSSRSSEIVRALYGDRGTIDEHVETLIEERRGLIRDTMREELDELEDASPPAEDTEGIRDGG